MMQQNLNNEGVLKRGIGKIKFCFASLTKTPNYIPVRDTIGQVDKVTYQ